MYKFITCPECGQRICKADTGSKVECYCSKCSSSFITTVEKSSMNVALLSKVYVTRVDKKP